MRSHSAALSRLAVMPAAALAVLVAPHLTGSHSASQAAAPYVPVAATKALASTDVAAPKASTAHETVVLKQFYAGVQQAKREATLKRFYTGVLQAQQAQRDATLARFYSGVQQQQRSAPVVVAQQAATTAPTATPAGPAANMNWSALAACESSGNPQAVSSGGYMGLYQFDQRTWESVGGTGSPLNASSAEQTYRAEILFSQRGSSPWPVCGSRLYS